MNFDLIRFHFTSPLHVANARADYGQSQRTLHSDALYAAVMQAWAVLGEPDWIADFVAGTHAFTLSSLFPFYGNAGGEPVYFFPKPYLQRRRDESADPGLAKKLKKAQWLEADRWAAFLRNESTTPAESDLRGAFLSARLPDPERLVASYVVPRIVRPRDEREDTRIFYTERLYFSDDSGLFGLVRYDGDEAHRRLHVALRLLADEGLGTDRAVGNGRFRLETAKLALDLPAESTHAVALSLYGPETPDQLREFLDEHAGYEVVKRGGWLSEPHNTLRKRSVYFFREGSVLRTAARPQGKTIDLRPDVLPDKHPVWRVGKALFVPVTLS